MISSAFLLEEIIINLNAEYYTAADACNGVGDEHRPYNVGTVQQTLYHKGKCSYTHHQECRQCNAVGVAGAYGCYSLWQIAKYHSNTCYITAYGVKCALFHLFFIL